MDVDTFFARTRKFLIDLLNKETTNRAVRSQATTWIRFVRDEIEQVSLAFNSRMMTVYSLNDKNEIVTAMIEHMAHQIENPALRNSKFVFDRVLHMDIDFHRLNLMRGSSYVLLPDWLMKKKAIINPKNSDMECFKWAVIAAMNWDEIGNNPEVDSWDKFEEKQLPSKDEFYSKLNMSGISEKDHQHACKVWNEFGLKNMGDYHDLYLKTDVILLANVFELFRKVCSDNYGLDPAQFYTAPGLAWKACLKKTGVNLELLKDPDMLLMFERGIRGGITQSVHKWAIVNNPYMGCEYNPLQPTNYLQYLDANNLYGWAMSQPLPTGEFKWVDIENLKQEA